MAENSRETCTRTRRPIVAGVAVVAMVARQGETYNVLGDLRLKGLRWLQGVKRLVRVLGDLWLQGLR